MLIEKLADGRILMDKKGLRSYLLDFLCDEAAAIPEDNEMTSSISIFFSVLDADDRDAAISDAVDSLFVDTSSHGVDRVFEHIFGIKLERDGRFFYAVDINRQPTELSLVDNNG